MELTGVGNGSSFYFYFGLVALPKTNNDPIATQMQAKLRKNWARLAMSQQPVRSQVQKCAYVVLNPETGKSLEYWQLLKYKKLKPIWSQLAANEYDQLFKVLGKSLMENNKLRVPILSSSSSVTKYLNRKSKMSRMHVLYVKFENKKRSKSYANDGRQ